ncbi:MAG: hypothetical protein D6E12_06240 [Desulfovibrio sp.]|nr:MAG: hypothetical protein D6E12_06240 [Desulfovibrio sp.]
MNQPPDLAPGLVLRVRLGALLGMLLCVLGLAWHGYLLLKDTPSLSFSSLSWVMAAVGWTLTGTGWFYAVRTLRKGWLPALLGLALAAAGPSHVWLIQGFAHPETLQALARNNLLAPCLMHVFATLLLLYLVINLRAAIYPRSPVFSFLRLLSRPTLFVLVCLALPATGQVIHSTLRFPPHDPILTEMRSLALEAGLRSRANARICSGNPDSPNCLRPMTQCRDVVALLRAELPDNTVVAPFPAPADSLAFLLANRTFFIPCCFFHTGQETSAAFALFTVTSQ